jgi:hypothetical protein
VISRNVPRADDRNAQFPWNFGVHPDPCMA